MLTLTELNLKLGVLIPKLVLLQYQVEGCLFLGITIIVI